MTVMFDSTCYSLNDSFVKEFIISHNVIGPKYRYKNKLYNGKGKGDSFSEYLEGLV